MSAPAAPVVTAPYPVDNFSTNIQEQTISGIAGAGTARMIVQLRPDIVVAFNPATMLFSFSVVLTEGNNNLLISGVAADGSVGFPYRLQIVLTSDSQLTIGVSQPTGILLASGKDRLVVQWQSLDDPDVLGYYVRRSNQPAGGTIGYSLLTKTPISEPYQVAEQKKLLDQKSMRISDTEELDQQRYQLSSVTTFQYVDSMVKLDSTIDSSDYYYVVTALKFDPLTRQEVESAYSAEVAGHVVTMSQQIELMPRSTQREVLVRVINSIYQARPDLDVKTGTVLRDLLDPVADEIADVYTLLDFMQRAQSFITLLTVDDANNDGVSDDVSQSEYKQALKKALNLEQDSDVQTVIDNAFTALASTFGVTRLPASPARASVIFYVTSEPTQDMIVDIGDVVSSLADSDAGIPEIQYNSLEHKVLLVALKDQYYNSFKERWELPVLVQATTPGVVGNVAAGAISSVVSGAVGFRVENPEPAALGQDVETNRELATRAILALAGIDTGTRYGYLRKALEVSGVRDAKVVASGDDLMYRDWDEVRLKHIGGKVDIYVQAVQFTEVVETVPFVFAMNQTSAASILSVSSMHLEVQDPIFAIEGNEILRLIQVRNQTRGVNYDITMAKIIAPNVVCLEMNALNLRLGLASIDQISVTYDRNVLQKFVLSHQPVHEVISVLGDLSGDLSNNYNLFKNDDSLWLGRSNRSSDAVQIFYSSDNNLPVDKLQTITDEPVTLTSEFRTALTKVGVDTRTVEVWNSGKTIRYRLGVDYVLEQDSSNVYATDIYRRIGGAIPDAATVLVSYQAAENVQITYSYNEALENVVTLITQFQHLTADVVIKEAGQVALDLNMTVGLMPGVSKETADPKVRSTLFAKIGSLKLGQPVYQSDVVGWVEGVDGVNYVILPMTRMTRADQTQVTGESISLKGLSSEWVRYQSGKAISWITQNPVLQYATVDGGGIVYQPPGRENSLIRFVAVYLDRLALSAQITADLVAAGVSRCFIRGDGRIIVSLVSQSDVPWLHTFSATYFAIGESGSKDVPVTDTEYPVLGRLVVNYKEVASGI